LEPKAAEGAVKKWKKVIRKRVPQGVIKLMVECPYVPYGYGHEWMFGVSVSFSGSLLHPKLTTSKLTP
jgi:hypothetical protein